MLVTSTTRQKGYEKWYVTVHKFILLQVIALMGHIFKTNNYIINA